MSDEKNKQFVGARPLTDDDIDKARKRLASISAADLNNIIDTYTNLMKGIVTLALKSTEDEEEIVELERMRRIINMLPKDELFLRSKDKIWAARDPIMSKNASWFLERDYSNMIKKDSKQVMIETIISIIRDKYEQLSNSEREMYWRKGIELLQIVAKYKKLTGED
jgi:hypothetical protein